MNTYIKPVIETVNIDSDNILESNLPFGDPDKTVGGGLSKERGNVYYDDDEGSISW